MARLNTDTDRNSTSVSFNQNIKLNVNPQPNEYNATIVQPVIIIAQDALELRIRDYKAQIEKSRDWMAPLGILLTLMATLNTVTFTPQYGMSADTIQAFFVMSALVSGVASIRAVYFVFMNKVPRPKELVKSIGEQSD